MVSSKLEFVFTDDSKTCELLSPAFIRYSRLIQNLIPSSSKIHFSHAPEISKISIQVFNCENFPQDGMNEAYSISVSNGKARILAESEWGVLHGLESFTQLIHKIDHQMAINDTFISDFPRFQIRGLLIDTSRHFLPLSVIKAMISTMSWVRNHNSSLENINLSTKVELVLY